MIFDKVSSPKNILTFVFEGEKVTEIVNMFEIYILSLKKKRKETIFLIQKSFYWIGLGRQRAFWQLWNAFMSWD